ncbi:MAG: hypothetical protein HQK60_02305 [Deltaproteobacteria bacterium]|nr:hypothetical protein [Deltaproteobacteria bacterium]
MIILTILLILSENEIAGNPKLELLMLLSEDTREKEEIPAKRWIESVKESGDELAKNPIIILSFHGSGA